MEADWGTASGEIARGHRVASGASGDPRFPEGTIAAQLPLLRCAIPDLDTYLHGPAFAGTINVRFGGARVRLRRPELFVPELRWTAHFPPESFHLSRAVLTVEDRPPLPVFLYIPDPATKPDHIQPDSIVELLAAFAPGLGYGMSVTLRYATAALSIAEE